MKHGFDDLSRAYTSTQISQRMQETGDFVAWVAPQPADKALDVASGPATIARVLAPRVKSVIALDLSHSMLLEVKRLNSPANLLLTAGDVARLPFGNGTFNLLTCAYTFANLADLTLILRECARVVADAGCLAFMDVIASEDPSECEHLNLLEGMRSDFYTRIRTRSKLLENFREAGLRIENSMLSSGRQRFTDWLRLSPALTGASASRASDREEIIKLAAKAGLSPEGNGEDVEFRYQTEWFRLRRNWE